MSKEREIYEERLAKARRWRELGINPWGSGQRVEHLAGQILERHDRDSSEALEVSRPRYAVAGRVVALRSFGKAAFISVRDRSGEIQVHVTKDVLGDAFELFEVTDIGDFVGVEGTLFRSRAGELTIAAERYTPLTKSLRPLPDKWHGLQDVELRYRQRYLDLIGNPDVKRLFLKRTALLRLFRQLLDARDFVEVETPVLHSPASGALARPFVTHHAALDLDLHLRVAPRLYLKRLVVGGMERVYEIGRCFRNEGISTRHHPELTMLELHQAHATHEDLMDLAERMISEAAERICGSTRVPYQGKELDFGKGWKRIKMADAICDAIPGLEPSDMGDTDRLRFELLRAPQHDVERRAVEQMTQGELVGALFELHVEYTLEHPTFITHFPAVLSPFARRNDQDPELTDRFELFVAGREIARACSELNDPLDQRERLGAQVRSRDQDSHQTMDHDEDYLRALEHGMPPTASLEIGIDRLCMLFTGAASIRDVLLFPLLKPARK